MNFMKNWLVAAALALCCCGTQLWAGPFSVSYLGRQQLEYRVRSGILAVGQPEPESRIGCR